MISMRLSEAAASVDGSFIGTDIQFNGCSTDSRTILEGNLFIALHGTNFDGHTFISAARAKGASAALVEKVENENIIPLLVIEDSAHAMGQLAKFWRDEFDIPLMAITGSNGKTTVKEMVSSILGLNATVLSTKGNLNNHIGVPLTLFNLGREHKYAVIEMGANHPGEIAWLSQLAKPTIALITQCSPAHLEGFGTEDGVASAKAEIYTGLCDNGIAIVNADDKYANFWKDSADKYDQISFGLKNKADITASNIAFNIDSGRTGFLIHFPEQTVSTSIPLSGEHNVRNSLAAAACCIAVGVPIPDIKKGLENMKSITGRLQLIKTKKGTRIFDDTYNANPGSLHAGLDVLSKYKGKRWLILGDMGELGDLSIEHHRNAGESARHFGIERLYGLGELSKYAVEGFGNGAQHFMSSDELISTVKSGLNDEVTVLIKGSRAMAMENIVQSLAEDN